MTLIKCFATIDDSKAYPCVADPEERWNGWACPRFTYRTILRILRESGITITDQTHTQIFGVMNENVGEEVIAYLAPDARLWATDGWCWDIRTKRGCYIYADGSVRHRLKA